MAIAASFGAPDLVMGDNDLHTTAIEGLFG
jgi:hypothetical protein